MLSSNPRSSHLPTVRDLKPQADFYQALLADKPTPRGDAEAWLAAQVKGIGAPIGLHRPEWLLAEGCEDCVRDLAASTAWRSHRPTALRWPSPAR